MPLNKITVVDPMPDEAITCPGCGRAVRLDPLDGWRNDNGFTCKPATTTHSDHIETIYTPTPDVPIASRHDIEALADSTAISEKRTAMLDLMRKRLTIDHSITLHRDSASAADVRAMLDHLELAGMPPEATLQVDGTDHHTRMYARWAEETH